jgi:hypothetical protein
MQALACKKRWGAWLLSSGLCAAIFAACLGTAGAQGSTFSEAWAHTWGASGDDELSGVATDGNGNVYVAGYTTSFGAGGQDVLLLKYSPSGTLLCRQTWGGSNNDWASDVALDPSGRFVYVAGATESSPSGNRDVLLVKFDSNCNFIWAQSWDFGGNEGAQRLRVDPSDGNLVLGGMTGIASANESAALLMKVSDPGSTPPRAPLWATSWDLYYASINDFFFGVSGGIYSCSSIIPPAGYGIDAYLARYDSSGNLQWVKTWNRDVNDSAFSCTSDAGGNVYVTGTSGEWAGNGQHVAYLLKFDPSGVLQWANTWGSGRNDQVHRVLTDTNGNVFMAGLTNGLDGTQQDVLLLKYDASGNLLESDIRRGNTDSQALSAVSTLDAILLAGSGFNSGGSWQQLTGTPGTGPTATTLQSVGSVSISLTPTGVVGTTSAPIGMKDSGGGGSDAFVAKIVFRFLNFPLHNKTADSAAVNSVFDHSMTGDYCPDEVITAYTGEEGFRLVASDFVAKYTCSATGKSNRLYGFANGHANFTVNGNYLGGSFLYYEGHPGYDYRTTDQNQDGTLCSTLPKPCNPTGKTPVLAAADGTVVCVANVAMTGKQCSGATAAAFNEVKIDHGNGYSTDYLHLSKIYVKLGDHVADGQVIGVSGDAGVPNNPHLHFEVLRNDGNVPIDPYGWVPNPALPAYGQMNDPYTRGNPPVVNIRLWK